MLKDLFSIMLVSKGESIHAPTYRHPIQDQDQNLCCGLFHSEPRTASKPVVQKSIAETEDQSEPRKTKNKIFLTEINQGK